MTRLSYATTGLLVLLFASPQAWAERYEINHGKLIFSIESATGAYAIDDGEFHFSGKLPGGGTQVSVADGRLRFRLAEGVEASVAPAPGDSQALLMSWRVLAEDLSGATPVFPDFRVVPAGLHSLSHRQLNFAPPVFDAPQEVSTPWVLFNEAGHALIISPASAFFMASMMGDARQRVAVGMNAEVGRLPQGFSASSLVASAPKVTSAYAAWGGALRALYGRKPTAPDADATLRFIGELTDNAGGYYYYNYDYADGLNYEDSLVRFVDRSRSAGVALGYLQLDSWWYSKSSWNPHEQIGKIKNPALPDQEWNRYGGLVEWRAHPGVFPKGMAAFHDRVKLPFLAHNRFVDKDSPYRQRFQISGVAAVDPGYWNELADYAAHNGISIYLQDWLDATYKFSPELHSVPGRGEAFLDGMANAMQAHGITMQYCMAYPLHMLQGAKYPNLTTIRAAVDGLTRDKWTQLAFNARFIRELGAWPATDVFPSADGAAMLFATLSGGPIGIGDSFEKLDPANLSRASRLDGVIVKPDGPLEPLDRSYLTQARASREPILAAAFTQHGPISTAYVLAFADDPSRAALEFTVSPAELGFEGRVAMLDPVDGRVIEANSHDAVRGRLTGTAASAYHVVAPITAAGIAVFGDLAKYVSMGRARVASYEAINGGVRLALAFAAQETDVTISGYSRSDIVAHANAATVTSMHRDPASGLFAVHLHRLAGVADVASLVLASAPK